ncbi:MAG: hypothetical protein OHK0021_02590 [Bryobacter sp.]
MSFSQEFAEILGRDIERLQQQVAAFSSDDALWQRPEGMANTPGNLVLHLEGNLRDFLGRQFCGTSYERQRDLEFSSQGFTREQLQARLVALRQELCGSLAGVPEARWEEDSGMERFGITMTWRQFALHLFGHFSYHLGQVDSARRICEKSGALAYVNIQR